MLLPRKLIILAIIIHVVTIIACASLQPDKDKPEEQPTEQPMENKSIDDDQQNETVPAVMDQ